MIAMIGTGNHLLLAGQSFQNASSLFNTGSAPWTSQMLHVHQTCMHPFLPPAALVPTAAPAPLPQADSAPSLFAVVPLPAPNIRQVLHCRLK